MEEIIRECPVCSKNIKIEVPRWPIKTICPNCNSYLIVEYDVIYDVENNEEDDLYTLKNVTLEEYDRY